MEFRDFDNFDKVLTLLLPKGTQLLVRTKKGKVKIKENGEFYGFYP